MKAKSPSLYENRELSWLRFNERVLEEAEASRVPLCERLNFLSIFQSNLDEFFMVRIGSLYDQKLVDPKATDNKSGMTAGEQMEAALSVSRDLCHRKDRVYAQIFELLKEQGISLVDFHTIGSKQEKKLAQRFKKEFQPFLSTMIVAKKQAFPFLANKEIYAVAVLATRQDKERIGIVPCTSPVFKRLIEVPDKPGCFMFAEELILHYLPLLFPNFTIAAKSLVRITRNADIDADAIYDEELNYRDHMVEVIKRRKRLAPIRVELSRSLEAPVVKRLCDNLNLKENQLFSSDSPLELSFLGELRDLLRTRAELFYAPRHPQDSPQVDLSLPVIPQIVRKDVLLHFPYESVRPFLSLLNEAARDPKVTHICMTLYRLAPHSKVVEALADAAENGKQVDVLVELKARFDEESNIEWSRRLEQAGCHVIYGVEHLKVHSKLCLIMRDLPEGTQYITQIGTGNYNEKTSRLYTDLCYITARPEIGLEAWEVFSALLEGKTVEHTDHLLVAPNCLQNRLAELIDAQIARAAAGKPAHIRVKINSMSDKVLIDKLIEAGKAGVKIEMIIRGINCLRSAVPGETDNIRIISIVGRYLEHSRIYLFGDGEERVCYIGSADWMTRNTLKRVEIACPIEDRDSLDRLEDIFTLMWSDNCAARVQQADGTYKRLYPGIAAPVRSQERLSEIASRAAARAAANRQQNGTGGQNIG